MKANVLWFAVLAACGGASTHPSTSRLQDVEIPDESTAERPSAKAEVRRVEELMEQGNVAQARQALDAYADLNTDARAQLDLGLLCEAAGDAAGARTAYERAAALAPRFAHAHANLAAVLRDAQDYQASLAAADRALALDSHLAGALVTRALDLEDLERTDEAQVAYRRALSASPSAQTHVNFGLLLLRVGKTNDAVRQLREATADESASPGVLISAGNGLRRAGEPQSAVRALERALLAIDAPSASVLAELALAYNATNDHARAESTLARAIALTPNDATLHYIHGGMLAARGAFPEAITAYQRVLTLSPSEDLATRTRERLEAARAQPRPAATSNRSR